jgi:hypothetical protein
MKQPDLINVVEAAYQLSPPSRWLECVTLALRPLLDRGSGTLAYVFNASNPASIELGEPVFAGAGREVWDAMQASTDGLEPRAVQRTYLGSRTFGSVAQRFTGSTHGIFAQLSLKHYRPNGFRDLLVLHVVDADHRGCLFAAPSAQSREATRKEITRWGRVAAHVRAGYRVARRLESLASTPLDAAAAILATDGRLLHAQGLTKEEYARDALRRAVLASEHARTSRVRSDTDQALGLYQELIAGRWTLTEHIDTDGCRLLAAYENDAEVCRRSGLTRHEQDVVTRTLRGQSNKQIALDLSVSEATVSERLANALQKLGLRALRG